MKRTIQTIRCLIAATVLLALMTSVTLAHFVTPTCGAVTFNDTNIGWTAVVQPGDLVFGPFTHDGDSGPYKIAPGSYTYTFVDTAGKPQETGSFTVTPCALPSPSATPAPSATPHRSPSATPPATDETYTTTGYNVEANIAGDIFWIAFFAMAIFAAIAVSIAYLNRTKR